MTDKQQEIKRSNKGMRPLAYTIKPITKKAFGGKSPLFGKLILEWASITKGLGCEKVTPIKLTFPRGKNNGATLSLTASSSQAFTLQHSTTQILQRINQFFGYNSVDKISFIHQTTATPQKKKIKATKIVKPETAHRLEKDLQFIDDSEMKKALVALGKSVIHKHQDDSQLPKKDKTQ